MLEPFSRGYDYECRSCGDSSEAFAHDPPFSPISRVGSGTDIGKIFLLLQIPVRAQTEAKGTALSYPFKYMENGPIITRIVLAGRK